MIVKKFVTKINSIVPIVDVEIGNDISPDWDYTKSDVITFGYIQVNNVTIIQREKTDKIEDFKKEIKKIMETLPTCYSFNFRMEKGSLDGFVGIKYFFEEIKPWKGKGWNKDAFFKEVQKITRIDDEIICPFDGDGGKVQDAYTMEKYDEIIAHNLTCLTKEAYIMKYKFDLLKKFEGQINSSGWYNA